MKNLQKAGGVSALICASTYIFAMGLVATVLGAMANTNLGFTEYIAFLKDNKYLIFVWHLAMYYINGVALTILVLAIYELLKDNSPRLAKMASSFGFIWVAFVFLSGLITNYGVEALISLYGKNPAQAENLKISLDTVTIGIDSSDKLLGCLWVGLVSIAAYKCKAFPKGLNIFGLLISVAGLVGAIIPALKTISYVFGVGAIIWWIGVGVMMLRKQTASAVK